jgi:hypothetical protein
MPGQRPIRVSASHKPGFHVVKRRWVVERTLGWLMLHRRLAREYETRPDHASAMIRVASIDNLTRRITGETNANLAIHITHNSISNYAFRCPLRSAAKMSTPTLRCQRCARFPAHHGLSVLSDWVPARAAGGPRRAGM